MKLFGKGKGQQRIQGGAMSAERTPVRPPAPTNLVSIFPMPEMELMGGIDGARPVKPQAEYSIERWASGFLVLSLDQQDHASTMGIITMVLGGAPVTLEQGGNVGQEWKRWLDVGNWLVVRRTR